MVLVNFAVSMISKSSSYQCTGIRLCQADDTTKLEDIQRHIAASFPCRMLHLFYRGCEVSSHPYNATLKTYCPASVSLPRFSAVYCSKGFNVHVQVAERELPVDVLLSAASVLDLKRLLQAKTGIPTAEQCLLYAGKLLDNCKLLSDCNVHKGAKLELVRQPPRVPSSSSSTYSIDILSRQERSPTIQSPTAPEWLRVSPGLNIQGRCDNKLCRAYQRIVVNGGYTGAITPDDLSTTCPVCSTRFQPAAYIFTDCCWAYDSRQFGSNWQTQDVGSTWQHVTCDQYQRFQAWPRYSTDRHVVIFSVQPLVQRIRPTTQTTQLQCPICHEPLASFSVISAACGHGYHYSCCAAWKTFQPKAGCAVCGEQLDTKVVRFCCLSS